MAEVEKAREAGKTGEKKEKQILLTDLDKLKEGMVMARNLRIKDGRLLLGIGMIIKKTSIESIRMLAEKGLLEDNVYVAL